MRTFKHYLAGAAALLAVFSSGAAQAAGCWSDQAYADAQVREFETMLMVSALRCRLGGADFLADYNHFVRISRPALAAVNDRLRIQFDNGHGKRAALDAYDRYVTSIANRYGAGSEGLNCADLASITRAALAANGSAETLKLLAERAGAHPDVPGIRCTPSRGAVTIASAR
jgi:hypothetical protein